MGRAVKDTIQLGLRIKKELCKRIDNMVNMWGISRTELIRIAISEDVIRRENEERRYRPILEIVKATDDNYKNPVYVIMQDGKYCVGCASTGKEAITIRENIREDISFYIKNGFWRD